MVSPPQLDQFDQEGYLVFKDVLNTQDREWLILEDAELVNRVAE